MKSSFFTFLSKGSESIRKWMAHSLDRMGLYLLHRQKSQQSQFTRYDRSLLEQANWDIVYPTPDVPEVHFEHMHKQMNYEIQRFSFQSPMKFGNEINDRVQGNVYFHSSQSPIHVIVVHGWRMDQWEKINRLFLKPFNKSGFHMWQMMLPFHFDRAYSSYSGEYMISANIERSIFSVRQAVMEIRSLIRWIKQNKGGSVILVGVSLGGLMTNLVATVEEYADAVISIMYANSLSYAVWHTPIGKYIKQDLQNNGVTYDMLKEYWEILEPISQKPKIDRNRILFIAGRYDQYVHFEDALALQQAWNISNFISYRCGHAGIIFHRKKIANDVLSFIHRTLSLSPRSV